MEAQEERRASNEPIAAERRLSDIGAVLAVVTQVHDKIGKLDDKLSKHVQDETTDLANEIAKVMLKAFPHGDADGHRRYHEMTMQRTEASTKFWQTLATEITKFGLLGFLAWAGYAIWKSFLIGPK